GTPAKVEEQKRGALAFAPQPAQVTPVQAAAAPPAGALAEKKLEKHARPSREEREMAADFAESTAGRQKDASPSMAGRAAEAPGGEGAAASSLASAEPGRPARLVVQALDGQGNIPEVLNANAGEMLPELKGRRYTLLVEASGRVREARLEQPRPQAPRAAQAPQAPQALQSMPQRSRAPEESAEVSSAP